MTNPQTVDVFSHETTAAASRGGITTAVVSFAEALDSDALAAWLDTLLGQYGAAIVRIKGVVRLQGEDRAITVSVVDRIVHPPKFLTTWPDGLEYSTIMFTLNGLDGATLHDSALAAGLPVLMTGVEPHPTHAIG